MNPFPIPTAMPFFSFLLQQNSLRELSSLGISSFAFPVFSWAHPRQIFHSIPTPPKQLSSRSSKVIKGHLLVITFLGLSAAFGIPDHLLFLDTLSSLGFMTLHLSFFLWLLLLYPFADSSLSPQPLCAGKFPGLSPSLHIHFSFFSILVSFIFTAQINSSSLMDWSTNYMLLVLFQIIFLDSQLNFRLIYSSTNFSKIELQIFITLPPSFQTNYSCCLPGIREWQCPFSSPGIS